MTQKTLQLYTRNYAAPSSSMHHLCDLMVTVGELFNRRGVILE
jgi:hypothetical protein